MAAFCPFFKEEPSYISDSMILKVWMRTLQRLSVRISTTTSRIGHRKRIEAPTKRFIFKDNIIKHPLSSIKVRQWPKSWQSYLGNDATPKALVDVIVKKNVGLANNLKDKIKTEFKLV